MSDNVTKKCTKNNQRCSKQLGHHGRCNKENVPTFWKKSPVIVQKEIDALNNVKRDCEQSSMNAGKCQTQKYFLLCKVYGGYLPFFFCI